MAYHRTVVLSPLLWLIFVNRAPGDVRGPREEEREDLSDFKDLIYADDVTTLIAAESVGVLKDKARRNV